MSILNFHSSRYLFLLLSVVFSTEAWADGSVSKVAKKHESKKIISPQAIYGEDDRAFVKDVKDTTILNLSKSITAQFQNYSIYHETDKHVLIKTRTLSEAHQVCPDVKFSSSTSLSQCTGFLVGPDLLLTAGHCVKDKTDCDNVFFSFDYTTGSYQEEFLVLPKENVYRCKQVLQSNYGVFSKTDFALVKLDRKVPDRKPLNIRRVGGVDTKDQLFVIGHPMGLPQMYQPGGKVRSVTGINTFVTSLDTFSGNSGSPVFNKSTLAVEGILVKGEEDLDYDVEFGCYKNRVCKDNECRGETVLRTTSLPLLKIPLLK